ncbi:MAG: flagellar basal body-associated FliL family protein [Candidatus Muirbacterium halophilum]|nr:flagellar basal body-associated FliL family protein [Candidatus Muirbacterium halophilum]MCK9476071.1 flagellar basal body-associated FliL family protein [Candidatus Muirbacterium halophilum]
MAEEVKTGNPMIKYLIVAILGVIGIILVVGISFVVAKRVFVSQNQIDTSKFKIPEKVKLQLEEFLVPTSDNNGIIKVRIELGLSETEVSIAIGQKLGLVRDSVNKILVSKSAQEAIADYQSGKLNEEIRIKLNEDLKQELGGGIFDGKVKEIVAVYFLDFLVQ